MGEFSLWKGAEIRPSGYRYNELSLRPNTWQ